MANVKRPIHIASIVHVTDLHLFVNRWGLTRDDKDRHAVDKALAKAKVKGIKTASGARARRFADRLIDAVGTESSLVQDGGPVVVVQTGDVEGVGSYPDRSTFDGFTWLEESVSPATAVPWVSVFGNHDLWPGSFPGFRFGARNVDAQKRLLAANTNIVGPLPPEAPLRFPTASGPTIAIAPVNSVSSGFLPGHVFARGRLSPHPPGRQDAVKDLAAIRWESDDLRIVALHHPVHFFGSSAPERFPWPKRLAKADAVADALSESGVQLVLAGHRHKLDPGFQARLPVDDELQPPLRRPTFQLTAVSPTVGGSDERERIPRMGLCVYRIQLHESADFVSVDRHIYLVGGGTRSPTVERSIVRQIPLG